VRKKDFLKYGIRMLKRTEKSIKGFTGEVTGSCHKLKVVELEVELMAYDPFNL
jgi:hypothetical protein